MDPRQREQLARGGGANVGPNPANMPLDTSVRKIAVLPNGDAALITGPGLSIAGTIEEIDVTDLAPAEAEEVRKNLHQLKINRKSDNISIKAGKRTFNVRDKHFGKGKQR